MAEPKPICLPYYFTMLNCSDIKKIKILLRQANQQYIEMQEAGMEAQKFVDILYKRIADNA